MRSLQSAQADLEKGTRITKIRTKITRIRIKIKIIKVLEMERRIKGRGYVDPSPTRTHQIPSVTAITSTETELSTVPPP